MARIWERSVRRAKLPIAYSEGFSPRAKLSFGLALPTVFESVAEYADLTFDEPVPAEGLPELLTPLLPVGVDVVAATELEGKVESLQECVMATEWSLFVDGDLAEVGAWARDLLAADSLEITRERKGKTRVDDVREALLDARVQPIATDAPVIGASTEIVVNLATKPRALRPLEFLGINAPPHTFVLGRRLHQFISPVGARRDPLDVGAAQATHDLSRAS